MAEQIYIDDERIDRELAAFDQSSDAPVDSTIRKLHRELHTLAVDLEQPVAPNPHEEETACRKAVEQILTLPHEQSATPVGDRDVTELGAGTTLGQYRLLEKLGQGGMGAVHKALHTRLDKVVALKLLATAQSSNSEAISRFQREMKAVGKLDHPNLIRALDAGEEGGVPYLVMEYVEGIDLSHLLERRGPLPIANACELIRQAALGLEAAHQRGMVHRDIKPANLMLARQDFGSPIVKVLDLGLALLADEQDEPVSGLTDVGQVMGTFDYMAPEQAGDSHAVDSRVDIYSLGASLFSLLTGQPVFAGSQYQTHLQKLRALASEQTPSVRALRSDIPDGLADVVEKMLAKDPDQRYSTAKELIEALTPFAEGANLATLLTDESTDRPMSYVGSQTSTPRSESEVSGETSRRSFLYVAGALLLLIAPLGYYFGGSIFRFVTNQAELVIEVDDPSIQVRIIQNGIVVADTTNKRIFTLKSGKGQIEFLDKRGVKLSKVAFELPRAGKTLVRVKLQDLVKTPKAKPNPDRLAAEYVLSMGGIVRVNDQSGKQRIKTIAELPKEPFRLTTVLLYGKPKVTDADLAVFEKCEHLATLELAGTPITDAGVAHFKHCKHLTGLSLENTKVTDAGLAHFEGCTHMRDLILSQTAITDAGLAHFSSCRNLRQLVLAHTRVSGKGLAHLKASRENLELVILSDTLVDDESLEFFGECKQIRGVLQLYNTKVTAKGIADLKKALPRWAIQWSKP